MKRRSMFLGASIGLFAWACGRAPREARQVELNGINGEAFYVLDGPNNSTSLTYLEKYAINGFLIMLEKDTIQLGSTFEAMFSTQAKKFTVIVTSPIVKEISGPTSKDSFTKFTFKPSNVGEYKFEGIIAYDTGAFFI